MKMSIY